MNLFSSQAEYKQFYDKLRKYAKSIAGHYSLREDAIDSAMDDVVDWLRYNWNKNHRFENLKAYAQTIIDNSLKDSSMDRRIELVDFPLYEDVDDETGEVLSDNSGWYTFEITPRGRFLKVHPNTIANPSERRIVKLYSDGYTQADISRELKVTPVYVSNTLKKYTIPKKRNKTPDYQKPSLVSVYDADTGAFKRFEKPSGKPIA